MKTKQEKEKLYKLWFDTKSSELLEGWPLRDRDENYYVNILGIIDALGLIYLFSIIIPP